MGVDPGCDVGFWLFMKNGGLASPDPVALYACARKNYNFITMKLVVNTKNMKQEKMIQAFLAGHAIEFSMVQEKPQFIKPLLKKQLTKKGKQILDNLSQSVDSVKKYSKSKVPDR
ncbi:MAG: hypothetical protein IPH18_00570 [Chitinophagaceae bacterium]|nr:hypothetical protein [Chitinophagaceae bacterium]